MVAADASFRDERRTLGVQPREQQRGLQLRAGDRQRVTDATQWFAVNHERRRATFAGCNLRAHQRQRLGHTAHRPLHQRRITNQFAGKRLPGQHPRHETHAGAAVADIQRGGGGAQVVQTGAMHRHPALAVMLNGNAHRLKGAHGGEAVLAFQKTADVRGAVGERAEHDGAVGNGFVAGHAHRAGQRRHRVAAPDDVCHVLSSLQSGHLIVGSA